MTNRPRLPLFSRLLALVLLCWSAGLAVVPNAALEAVILTESRDCSTACRASLADNYRGLDVFFAGLDRTLAARQLEAEVEMDAGGLAAAAGKVRGWIYQILSQRLAAANNLLRLMLLRLALLSRLLFLTLLLAAAVAVDAAILRTLAHRGFESSRPAVSFTAALGFFAAVIAGFLLSLLPVAGAAAAGLALTALGCIGLHAWVRYFHRL